VAYNTELAIDFWYAFDQAFLFNTSTEVSELYASIYGINFAIDALVDSVRDRNSDLKDVVSGKEASFRRLAEIQLSIIDQYFPDPSDLQRAFEDFGQGILFDEKTIPSSNLRRRPVGRMIHMMDGSPDECVGYHRWHAFIRAAVVSGADESRWLFINKLVALAWAIFSEMSPSEDASNNPPIDLYRLNSLRRDWLSTDLATLNEAFLHYKGNFPNDYGSRRARRIDEVRYSRIQKILRSATEGSNPQHTGSRRFWDLPLAQFVLVKVYGHPLIAPKGPDRGSRSPLTMILRGTLPGFPRMPLNRPPLSAVDIAYIENWIDNLELA
jgi:hypothetical protein